MMNLSFFLLSLPSASAFLGCKGPAITRKQGQDNLLYSHSSVVSPYSATAIATSTTESPESPDFSLSELSQLLGVTPLELIRLESTADDGVRGVYLNANVNPGDLIVKVPLQACLLDDEPPSWWTRMKEEQHDNEDNDDFLTFAYNSPSDWAPRLAASLLDMQLQLNTDENNDNNENEIQRGKELWLSFLPKANHLRASLPVHWSEETLSSARCTALELAVDSAYFARAEAVADLVMGLQPHCPDRSLQELQRICQNTLDVVQTRSCRVEPPQEIGFPLRVLAPVFDLINHGSSSKAGEGSANAAFALEEDCLCVRATKALKANEEVLIDYGSSAKPAWKCLLSYGFVPQYTLPGDENESDDDGDDEAEDVAEMFLDGHRYEVGPSTIPLDMVTAACATSSMGEEEEPQLTPEIALKLAKRISEVSMYLLLDDKKKKAEAESDLEELPEEDTSIEELISLRGAASLRWSQHHILQACAKGLREWATE